MTNTNPYGQTINGMLKKIKMLEAIVQIDNRNKNALKKLGDLYMDIQDYEKARTWYWICTF